MVRFQGEYFLIHQSEKEACIWWEIVVDFWNRSKFFGDSRLWVTDNDLAIYEFDNADEIGFLSEVFNDPTGISLGIVAIKGVSAPDISGEMFFESVDEPLSMVSGVVVENVATKVLDVASLNWFFRRLVAAQVFGVWGVLLGSLGHHGRDDTLDSITDLKKLISFILFISV